MVHKEKISMPGPGNYDQKEHIGQSGPKFTFSTKLQPKVKDNNPGPGNYEGSVHMVKDRVVSHKIS